jgi:hypothetical protein
MESMAIINDGTPYTFADGPTSNGYKIKIMAEQTPIVDHYFLDFSKEIRKSIVLYKQTGSVATPMAYISRPKWIEEKDFEEFVRSLKIYKK